MRPVDMSAIASRVDGRTIAVAVNLTSSRKEKREALLLQARESH